MSYSFGIEEEFFLVERDTLAVARTMPQPFLAEAKAALGDLVSAEFLQSQIEIVTVKEAAPSRDWMNPHLGYLATSRARAKVQHWFRLQDRDKNIVAGRAALERELKRLGPARVNYERLAEKVGYADPDELFVAIAHNDIKSSRYLQAAQALLEPVVDAEQAAVALRKPARRRRGAGGFHIAGVGNLLTHVANCCKPVPGDDIRGYITAGRGVTVHRSDCPNVLRYQRTSPERVIVVEWGGRDEQTFPVDVEISAFDRKGLLNDVTAILANEKLNLTAINTASDDLDHTARMRLTMEVPDIETLSRVLTRINQLQNVRKVRRILR